MAQETGSYERPDVVDYGSLLDLTLACVTGVGGDAAFPSGSFGGLTFGTSAPQFGCTSG
jgi:hypothetical protein